MGGHEVTGRLACRSESAGSGAPSRRRATVVAIIVLGALLALVMASPAFAVQHLPLETFGSAEQPTFGAVKAVAVDQATGDVLVADGATNSIRRYHADGTPAPFSALGSNEITTAGFAGEEVPLEFTELPSETEIAIDESFEPSAGDIYVTQALRHLIYIFSETGKYLGQLEESTILNSAAENEEFQFGEVCGVAVDKRGFVYVADFSGVIYKFSPGFNPVTHGDGITRFTGVQEPCNIAVGSGSSAGKLLGPVDLGKYAEKTAEGFLATHKAQKYNGSIDISGATVTDAGVVNLTKSLARALLRTQFRMFRHRNFPAC